PSGLGDAAQPPSQCSRARATPTRPPTASAFRRMKLQIGADAILDALARTARREGCAERPQKQCNEGEDFRSECMIRGLSKSVSAPISSYHPAGRVYDDDRL